VRVCVVCVDGAAEKAATCVLAKPFVTTSSRHSAEGHIDMCTHIEGTLTLRAIDIEGTLRAH